jgi:hypothetical protein
MCGALAQSFHESLFGGREIKDLGGYDDPLCGVLKLSVRIGNRRVKSKTFVRPLPAVKVAVPVDFHGSREKHHNRGLNLSYHGRNHQSAQCRRGSIRTS